MSDLCRVEYMYDFFICYFDKLIDFNLDSFTFIEHRLQNMEKHPTKILYFNKKFTGIVENDIITSDKILLSLLPISQSRVFDIKNPN